MEQWCCRRPTGRVKSRENGGEGGRRLAQMACRKKASVAAALSYPQLLAPNRHSQAVSAGLQAAPLGVQAPSGSCTSALLPCTFHQLPGC